MKKNNQDLFGTSQEIDGNELEQLYSPRQQIVVDKDYQTMMENSRANSPYGKDKEEKGKKEQEREELQKTCDDNNDIIRQILKETAMILQRPDSEARMLRTNVIQPDKLSKYALRRFVGKTIQLNVG